MYLCSVVSKLFLSPKERTALVCSRAGNPDLVPAPLNFNNFGLIYRRTKNKTASHPHHSKFPAPCLSGFLCIDLGSWEIRVLGGIRCRAPEEREGRTRSLRGFGFTVENLCLITSGFGWIGFQTSPRAPT